MKGRLDHPLPLRAALAVAAVLGLLAGLLVDRRGFFASWLTAWWACAGAILGSQANLWLHDLTGGAWGQPLRPVWQAAGGATPALLVLMLPLLAAAWLFYPWSAAGWLPQTPQPRFQAFWLHPAFVTLRLLVYAAIWLWLSLPRRALRDGEGRPASRKLRPAVALILYGVTVSLAGVDLVQSLLPQWHSSGFGMVLIAMQMKLGFAWGVVGATASDRWRGEGAAEGSPTGPAGRRDEAPRPFPPGMGRDWGNLLLMYVMMWAYLAYVQFLIIWAENLPPEIAWYVPRLQTAWVWLGAGLVVLGFLLPFLLLLMRAVKQHRLRLRWLALWLLVLGWAEAVWVILPSVAGLGWHAAWMAPLATAAMAAVLILFRRPLRPLRIAMRRRPLAISRGGSRP